MLGQAPVQLVEQGCPRSLVEGVEGAEPVGEHAADVPVMMQQQHLGAVAGRAHRAGDAGRGRPVDDQVVFSLHRKPPQPFTDPTITPFTKYFWM